MAGEYLVEKFGVDPYANRPGQYLIDHFGVDPSIATQQAEQPARQPIPLAPPPSPANPFARPAPLGQVSQPTARVQQAQRMQQTQQAQQTLQDTFTRTSPSQSYLERTAMSGELDDLIGKRREYLMDLNQQMLKEDRYNPYELVNALTPYDDAIATKTKELEGVGGRPGAERAGYWAKSVWNSLIGSVGMAKHFVSAASFEYAQNRLNPEWIEKDKQYKAAQREYDKWYTQHQIKMETPMSGEEVKANEDIGKQLEMKLASAKKSRDDVGVKIAPNGKFIETMRRASADPRGVDYEKFASDKPLGTIPFKPDANEPELPDKETSYDWFRRGQEQMALAVKDLPEQDTFYVQVGASAAQNVVLYSLALISPSIPLTVMSTSAAGRYMMELSDRGISSQEALARGIVSGAIEYMTESLPLEVLASVVSKNRPLLEAILKMAGTEAAEEGIAAILNYIADLAANDPAAELSLEELLLEMYGGAVSGLFLGGFYSSLGKVYSGLTGKRANVGKIKNLDLLIDKMSGEQLSDADNQLATKAGEELARQLDVLLSESEGSIASMSDLVNEDGTPKTMEQLLGDYGEAEAADAQAIHDDEDYSQIYKFKRDRDSQAEAKDYEALRELPQVKRTPIPIREAQPDNLIKPIPMVSDQATIDRLGKLLPSSDIFTIPTENIKVAPSTYQFKSDVDASGTTRLLKNVEVFDKNKAGVILVHQRNNGDIYVVNGHHRLELARRLRVPDLDVRVIRESDGVSVEEARRVGALMNIAEGRGTPLDADKIFREGNLTASELKKHGVSLTESLVQKGYGLSKLNSDVHSAVLNGMLSEDHGAMIGNAFENDPARQTIAYKTVKRIEASGKNVNNQMVQQAINITKAAEISGGDIEQYNLFGGDEATSGDTKMDLVAKVTQELERIKRTFAPLTSKDKTQRISEVGNVLDNAKNRRIHKNATENLQNIEKFAYYVDTGIGTLFNEYANLVFNGEMTEAQAVSEIVSELGDVSYAEGQSRHGQGRQADARDIAAAKRAPESREGRQAAELPKTERSSEAAAQAQEIRKRLSDFVKENNLKVSESDIENIMFSISDSVDAGFLNRVAKRFGVNIEVAPIGVADAEGYYDRARNTIVLSPNAVQADVVRGVVLHELTHFAESSGRYAELKAFVVEQMPNFGRQVQAKIEQYKRSDVVLTQRQAGAEVVADYVRNTLFADPAAVEKLVSEKPGAARQLYDAIVRMIEKLKAVVTGAEIDQLEQGRLLFEKALSDAGVKVEGQAQYSIENVQHSLKSLNEAKAELSRLEEVNIFDLIRDSTPEALTERNKEIIKLKRRIYNLENPRSEAQKKLRKARMDADLQVDKQYFATIEAGDMDAARDIVESRARELGYSPRGDYHSNHSAPTNDGFNAPLHDLTRIYPDDIYSNNAIRYYGGSEWYNNQSIRVLQSVQGQPDKKVTIYRAVPSDLKESSIRNGDWVSVSRDYAEVHGKAHLDKYKIIWDKVPAKHVFTNGDSVNEQGYDNGMDMVYADTKNNAKLLDTITYDDKGDVIPLSKRFNRRLTDIRYSIASDSEYMAAIESGDMEKVQAMVDAVALAKAADTFSANEADNPAFRVRRKPAPAHTITVYKKASVLDGDFVTLFIGGSSPIKIPIGVWVDAVSGYKLVDPDNGRLYTPVKEKNVIRDGKIKKSNMGNRNVEVDNKTAAELTEMGFKVRTSTGAKRSASSTSSRIPSGSKYILALAYRPGWHTGESPIFTQGGKKVEGSSRFANNANDVYYEIEIPDPAYGKWQAIADANTVSRDIQELPVDGSYKKITNPNKARVEGEWFISGTMKVVRPMAEIEVGEILKARGIEPQGWADYYDSNSIGELDLDNLGVNIATTDEFKKLRDPITYDDSGDIIPLSERFNKEVSDVRYSLSQSDLDKVRAEYQRLLGEYGAIKPGESPARDVEIPKRSSPEQKVRQTVRTFAESEHMTDEMAPALEKRIVDGALSYTVMDDALAVDYADDVLSSRGYEGALALWDAIAQIEKTAGKKQIVLGERLFIEAARRGDSAQALDILAQVAVEATNAGQAIQAIRIIKRMGKEGQLLTLQQAVNKINRNTEQRRNRKMTPEQRNEVRDLKKKMPKDQGKAAENLKKQIAKISGELYIPQPVLDNIMAAKTKAELDIAINDAYVQIAKQVQSTWIDKWNALRYFSMLANPRTHIRNIVGNAVFYPARQLKNTVKLALEKAPGYKGERTAAWLTKADQPLLDYAKAQYLEIEGELRSSGKMNPSDRIRDNVQVFKSSFLENARKLNFEALEVEDAWFLRNAFVSSMAQYLKANSIDINALKSGSKLAQKSEQRAISYAMQEAWKATYRDASAAATALNNLSRSGKVAGVVVEGIIPFKKTPLNIVKRGVEYSPIGLLRGIYNLSFAVDQGKVTAAEALDQFASGMSGSAIMTLGMLLASMGFLTGAGDEEDKQRSFDKLHGDQLYALKLGDKSYTIDWAAPTVMPLFAGAEIIRMAKTEGKFTATQWINALTTITEPIVNLSMMEGVEMAINAAAYGEFSPFTDIIINAATSYVSQAIPTALGQVARTIDPVRRDTYYTDKTSGIPRFAQRTAARTASRIPFASKALPRKIDAWGRETASGGRFETVIENFLSPGYYNVSNITAVDKEIQRLYDITGEPVFPTSPAKYFTQDGARVYLSAKDYERISIADGRKAFELLDQLIGLREYNALNDEDKAKLVQRVYDLSGAFGKNSIDKDVGYQKWMEQALSPPRGITTAEWLVLYQQHGSRLTSEKAQEAEKTIGVRNYLVLAEGLDNWRAERYELSLKVGSITAAEYQELSARGATQEEAQAYLDGLSIGQEEKAVMWSLINSGWKTNPYETTWPPKLPKLPKLEKLPKLPKLTG